MYFDSAQKLISFHVNCYAGGFPNLNWERSNIFKTFPPGQQAPLDSLITLNFILGKLQPVVVSNMQDDANMDYTIVVFWNKFMNSQTKRFIKIIQDNLNLANGKKVNVYYVNNDLLFSS